MGRLTATVLVLLACASLLQGAGAHSPAPSSSAAPLGESGGNVLGRESVGVWAQFSDYMTGGAYTSSLRLSDGYWSEAADDFELDYSASIDSIVWWGAHGPPEELEYVIVRFYVDDQTRGRGFPGALAYQETLLVFTGEECSGTTGSDYRYGAALPLPFSAALATRYWISIQGVELSGQWYWTESASALYWGDKAAFRSEFWGYPDWVPYWHFVDGVRSFSFILYADSSPVDAMSWGAVKARFR